MIAQGPSNQGYMVGEYEVSTPPLAYNGSGTAPPITLVYESGGVASGDQLTTQLPVDDQIVVNIDAGPSGNMNPVQQPLSMGNTYGFADWGTVDKSAGGACDWYWQQTSPVDVFSDQPDANNSGYPQWWTDAFDTSTDPYNVLVWSDLALGSVPFDALSVWTVTLPADGYTVGDAPPSCPVKFGEIFYRFVAYLFHNDVNGCHGCYPGNIGYTHHCMWTALPHGSCQVPMDLGTIAAMQNLSST
jgi:hypothetical protein